MSLAALAEQLKAADVAAGFTARPSVVASAAVDASPYDYHDDSPVPGFADRLPEHLTDPESGKKILLSQSKIKGFRQMVLNKLCPARYKHVSLLEDYEGPDSTAMAAGRRFEFELTGAMDRSGKEPAALLTPARGVPSEDQRRISENAELAAATLKRLDVPADADTQVTRRFKCLIGTYDLHYYLPALGVGIDDLKYSGLLGETGRWKDLGWYAPEVGNRFSHICQALHYTLLELLAGAEVVRFRFIVFDNRKNNEGEHAVFDMRASDRAMNEHKNLVLFVVEEVQRRLDGGEFAAVPSYSNCSGCPVECKQRVEHPETLIVKL